MASAAVFPSSSWTTLGPLPAALPLAGPLPQSVALAPSPGSVLVQTPAPLPQSIPIPSAVSPVSLPPLPAQLSAAPPSAQFLPLAAGPAALPSPPAGPVVPPESPRREAKAESPRRAAGIPMPATVPSAPAGPESPHRSFGKKIRDDYFFVSPYINPIGVSEPKTSMTDRVLVLDIDETLLHSFFEPEYVKAIDDLQIWTRPEFVPLRRVMDRATLKNAVGMPGEGRIDSIAIILRPHLKEFLAEACNYFSMVVIWSAGKPKYVEYVRTLIFADMPKPAILLTSEQCQIDPATGRQTKFLKVLFEKFPQQIRPDNTLLIDDRSDNTEPNGANGILIPEYRPLPVLEVDNPRKLSLTDNDTCLLDLMRWLKSPEVLQARDIRKTDRSRIFG